uniref:EF-hand domain-containing protein n=1 Tax=Neogobius melanostomus TaxID=47308 RepID=A0A8C6SD70_9GOBI
MYFLFTCSYDGSGKLGLVEFKILWTKIELFLKIYQEKDVDNSGTMSSMEMRGAVEEAGLNHLYLHLFNHLLVSRYSEPNLTIDFDNFTNCLVRLETMRGFRRYINLKLSVFQWLKLSMC